MSSLKTEYTDIKARVHKVEHTMAAASDSNSREQIIADLLRTLLKRD